MIVSTLYDDIIICNINYGWILTSYLDAKECFLIFLNYSGMTSAAAISLMGGC